MKKIYTLLAFTSIAFGISAQSKGAFHAPNTSFKVSTPLKKEVMSSRASGDTLMYMPLPGYSVNSTDAAAFGITTYDGDGFDPNYGTDYPYDFSYFGSTDSSVNSNGQPEYWNFYHPWEDTSIDPNTGYCVDTAFYWWATSWFDSPNQADNWLMFGPITIPAGGASLVWYDRTNDYRDGYDVLVSTSFSSPAIDFTDFDNGTNIFSVADAFAPSPTWEVDTTWELQNVVIPATFNGQQVVFAFHHNASDMDVLRLDEITVVDGTLALGIAEKFTNGVKVMQNTPNPFKTVSTIAYELEKATAVSLSVYDVTGKKVTEQSEGIQTAGNHSISFNGADLAGGVYYYSLKAGENSTSAMKMVIVK
jgi:hypothetical protein